MRKVCNVQTNGQTKWSSNKFNLNILVNQNFKIYINHYNKCVKIVRVIKEQKKGEWYGRGYH